MLTFHNNHAVKEKFVARVKAHRLADEIIKGRYWQDGKGCAVGCTIHGSTHADYETELGVPEWLARLEDRIFEGLPNSEAKDFPLQFLNAISVGVNLEPVKYKFLAFLMRRNITIVEKLELSDNCKTQVIDAIKSVLALHEEMVRTGFVNTEKRQFVRAAADAAYNTATEYAASRAVAAADAAVAAYNTATEYAAADAAARAYAADALAVDAATYAARADSPGKAASRVTRAAYAAYAADAAHAAYAAADCFANRSATADRATANYMADRAARDIVFRDTVDRAADNDRDRATATADAAVDTAADAATSTDTVDRARAIVRNPYVAAATAMTSTARAAIARESSWSEFKTELLKYLGEATK